MEPTPHNYDPEVVRFFDVAHEGAQVRALIAAAGQLHTLLHGCNPRSIVIVPTDHVARVCSTVVAKEHASAPVMVAAQSLPTFVGALDVVIVVGERAECDWASQALIAADNRGARTFLIGPANGPIVADAPAGTYQLPTLPLARGCSPARYIAGLQAILASLGQSAEATEGYLSSVAEQLDEELAQLSPERGTDVNPARQLCDFAQQSHIIHTGGSVAEVAAAVWAQGGLGGTYVEPELVPAVLERRSQAPGAGGKAPASADDIFYDPFLDGPALLSSKVIVWGNTVPQADAAGTLAGAQTMVMVPSAHTQAHPLQLITRAFAATAMNPNVEENNA